MTIDVSLTLRALSVLLRYPDAPMRAHLPELASALHAAGALRADRLTALDSLIGRLQRADLDAETQYVELFDRGRRTALHLFEHIHGDSRDRGPAMIDLIRTYEAAGLIITPDELPDYLPLVLEYASTQPPRAAREFVAEFGHLLAAIRQALVHRDSDYAAVFDALLDIAGVAAQPADEPAPEQPIDDTWREPAAFGGCDTPAGASRPAEQTVHLVRRAANPSSPTASRPAAPGHAPS